MRRRQWLAATAAGVSLSAGLLGGCRRVDELHGATPAVAWAGASASRGHRLRQAGVLPAAALQRRAGVLVLGGGVAGLAAARGWQRRGVDEVVVLELEDAAGGNSRGHVLAGHACPLGAHYLPVPPPSAVELREWLHELGLLRNTPAGEQPDERHLCHSPQERLFMDGAWAEGLLPPADPESVTAAQYRLLAAAIRALRGTDGRQFTLPAHRSRWGAEQAALDGQTFATWLDAQGLVDERLRWYLDYCCRDDYGAPAAEVSAWAGVHYFASRHGFAAPGEADAEREPVFTWPEGNAWLVRHLATPLGDRLLTGRTVLQVAVQRHGVQVLAWDEARAQAESWSADTVVLALPLHVAARVLQQPPPALVEAAARLAYAPWLVANVHLEQPLLDRPGAPPSWDNVVYGSRALGYVDAGHQRLRPHAGPTVISAYVALPAAERAALLGDNPLPWRQRVLDELARAHPDIHAKAGATVLARWGHAMAVPRPGLQRHPALLALRRPQAGGRLRFAHTDLAGYSTFEEAFTAGCEAALG